MKLIPHDLPGALSSMSSLTRHDKDLKTLEDMEASRLQINIEKRSDFTLFTKDGDKVTLSSLASLEAGTTTYTSEGTLTGEAAQTEVDAFQVNKAFELELSVEGDLNKQEIKDIRRAFTQMRKMVKNYITGREDKAMHRASKIMNFKSISGFEAVYQYVRTASAYEGSLEDGMPLPLGPGNPAPAPAVMEPVKEEPAPPQETLASQPLPVSDPSSAGPAAVQTVAPSVDDPAPVSPLPTNESTGEDIPSAPGLTNVSPAKPFIQVEIHQLVEKMTQVVVESNADTGKLAKYTSQYLNSLSASYSRTEDGYAFELKLVKQIQAEFKLSIQEAIGAGKAEENEDASVAAHPAAQDEETVMA
ncbi:MAG: hypothetical protein ACE5GK_00325 [Nitrospiria bacterium]